MIPAAVADSWFFWLTIIDGLAGIYILPTVIGVARRVHLPEHDPGRLARSPDPRLLDATQGEQLRSLPAVAGRRAIASTGVAIRSAQLPRLAGLGAGTTTG